MIFHLGGKLDMRRQRRVYFISRRRHADIGPVITLAATSASRGLAGQGIGR